MGYSFWTIFIGLYVLSYAQWSIKFIYFYQQTSIIIYKVIEMSGIKKDETFELEKRKAIYDHILEHPGLHLREISRQLDIPRTTLTYHIRYLERKNLLISENNGKCCRYFIKNQLGSIDKIFLSILRQDIPRKIIFLSYIFPEVYREELSKGLDIPVTTISYHVQKLKEAGILAPCKENGRISYELKNRNYIYNLIIRYKTSLLDDQITSDFITFVKIVMPNGLRPESSSHEKDKSLDEVCSTFFKIFPVPFMA